MAKAKPVKGPPGSTNKIANSRVRFLHDAAILMAKVHVAQLPSASTTQDKESPPPVISAKISAEAAQSLSRGLASDLRSVSRKTQLRLSPAIKYSVCKGCNTVLLEGSTCVTTMENRSRNGKKSWADVQVRTCNTCGLAKRCPCAARRQRRRAHRESTDVAMTDETMTGD